MKAMFKYLDEYNAKFSVDTEMVEIVMNMTGMKNVLHYWKLSSSCPV